jgi:microcystin-dependent protein
MYWDDTLGQLFIRYINGGAPVWVAAAPPAGGSSVIPAGTRMVFAQASAPTGWTQDTTAALNDSALRLVNTAGGGTGGTVAFTTAFASGLSSGSYTLAIADIPSHSHGVSDPGHAHTTGFTIVTVTAGPDPIASGGGGMQFTSSSTELTGISINANGGGGGHSHSLPSFAVKYVDLIIAVKN